MDRAGNKQIPGFSRRFTPTGSSSLVPGKIIDLSDDESKEKHTKKDQTQTKTDKLVWSSSSNSKVKTTSNSTGNDTFSSSSKASRSYESKMNASTTTAVKRKHSSTSKTASSTVVSNVVARQSRRDEFDGSSKLPVVKSRGTTVRPMNESTNRSSSVKTSSKLDTQQTSSKPHDSSRQHSTVSKPICKSAPPSEDRTVSIYNSALYAINKTEMTLDKLSGSNVAKHPLVRQIVDLEIERVSTELRKNFEEEFKLFIDMNSDRNLRLTRSLTKENHSSIVQRIMQNRAVGERPAIDSVDVVDPKRRRKSDHNVSVPAMGRPSSALSSSSTSSTYQSFHGFNIDTSLDNTKQAISHQLGRLKGKQLLHHVPKNTNRDLYFSNRISQICLICRSTYKRMVPHLKAAHDIPEVFVSRISPKMAKVARNAPNSSAFFMKGNNKCMKAMCFFCEETKDFCIQYWVQHIRSHTGEYANYCYGCKKTVCFHQHCGIITKCNDVINLKTTDLTAFICRDCNFVQISEKNLRKHLKDEHGFNNLENHYDKIVLLKAWDHSQPIQTASNHRIISGKQKLEEEEAGILTFR